MLVDSKREMPVEILVRDCLLNADSTFDVLIDIAVNPQTNEHSRRTQYSSGIGRFFGTYFGPVFIDYIERFIGDLQNGMNSNMLYSVILDGDTQFYFNESSVTYDETLPVTTTKKPNAFVGFFRGIGAAVQGWFHRRDGRSVSGREAEEFDPRGNRLPKTTSRALKARAAGEILRVATSKPSYPRTAMTVVITDGAQATPPSRYPTNSLILDIGGGWATSPGA